MKPLLPQLLGTDYHKFFHSDVENEWVSGDVPLPPDRRTDDQIARDEIQAELNHKHARN